MSHRFVWIDIPVQDLDRAAAFYSAIFDDKVKIEQGPNFKYGMLPHGQDDVAGCLYVPQGENKPCNNGPLVYLNADGRLKEAVAAVVTYGGQVLLEPHQIGPYGFRAIILDSEGNRVALHSMTN